MPRQKVTGTVTRVTKRGKPNLSRQAARTQPSVGDRGKDAVRDEDARLVAAAAGGDTEALERLLVRAQDVAWRFSMTVCGRAPDAEDAMQEALIKTFRYVDRIRDPRAFRPWLYRTVRNVCLMNRRKHVHEPARLESLEAARHGDTGLAPIDVASSGRNPEELAANAGLRRRLQRAMAALPGPYRAVVFLREVEGLSTREVAAALEISEDNVKTRLHRARVALQMAMEGRP
jgi:RNA polymerase sigma-70 factor (ECF subfamily)